MIKLSVAKLFSRRARVVAAIVLFAASAGFFSLATFTRATGPYAAPLPSPLLVAQGVGAANAAHLFVDRTWDFAQIRQGFNTVNLSPGDQSAVTAARAAGLSVILEFDYKTDFMSGKDISAKVNAIVAQVQANPGTISGLWVADRINEKYSGTQGLDYLAATGGVFHAQIPGVPVFVDVSDWEMTCNQPQQSSCSSPLLLSTYQYETNAVLTSFYQSGYIDGLFVADNLQNNNVAAQTAAWTTARALWPPPFVLVSRAAQLSFSDNVYTGNQATADALAAPYMDVPMQQGADGLALWAWHQVYQGTVSSFLNKDTSSNFIWQTLIGHSNSFGLIDITAPGVTVTSPTANATAVDDLVLAVSAADNKAVTRVEYFVDGTFVGSTTTAPFQLQWSTHSVANGTHQFTAKAYDAAGNVGTSPAVAATVGNTGPAPSPSSTPTHTPTPVPATPTPTPLPTTAGTPAAGSSGFAASSDGTDVAADLGSDRPVGETGSTTNVSSTPAPAHSYTARVTVSPVSRPHAAAKPSAFSRGLGIAGGALALLLAGLLSLAP